MRTSIRHIGTLRLPCLKTRVLEHTARMIVCFTCDHGELKTPM